MARAEALRLGPFVGGINSASDPTAVADSELVDCINFELDIDGSLVSRPPIVETVNDDGSWTDHIVVIGRGSFPEGDYLVCSNNDGTFAFDGTTWTSIQANLKSSVAMQYGGYMWIVPKPGTMATQPGGRWSPASGFTADANMPEGETALFHKARMFICPGPDAITNESRLRFTDPVSSSTLSWTSTNLIDVSPGDGEKLIDIIVYNDNLMLFKNDSTYILAYDLSPTDAILRNINSNIGVSDIRCVVSYENSIFVFHEGNVYEIINYDFTRINLKCPFVYDPTAPSTSTRAEEVFLSLLGDRLIVRYFNRIYVFGLKTRTWARWESSSDILHNFGPLMAFPTNASQAINTKYYAGSCLNDFQTFCFITDGYDAIIEESELIDGNFDIECYLKTKNYDLADSHHFKRLMWWGADVLTTRNITARANPITINYLLTWGNLSELTWGDLLTWGSPSSSRLGFTTNVINSNASGRLFTKFLKGLRFRQINFELTLLNNGSTGQGPCRVFTLTAIVGSKQTVSKQVN